VCCLCLCNAELTGTVNNDSEAVDTRNESDDAVDVGISFIMSSMRRSDVTPAVDAGGVNDESPVSQSVLDASSLQQNLSPFHVCISCFSSTSTTCSHRK